MDFHIDKKIAWLLVGALVIGFILGNACGSMMGFRHMSRMENRIPFRGDMTRMMDDNFKNGDMQKMMQGKDGGINQTIIPTQVPPQPTEAPTVQ